MKKKIKETNKSKKISKKFKGGGYFKSEEIMPGVTFMEMNGKGFYEEFCKGKDWLGLNEKK